MEKIKAEYLACLSGRQDSSFTNLLVDLFSLYYLEEIPFNMNYSILQIFERLCYWRAPLGAQWFELGKLFLNAVEKYSLSQSDPEQPPTLSPPLNKAFVYSQTEQEIIL